MKTFKSDDTFKIAGRGTTKIVRVPNPDRLIRPEGVPEVGEIVEIDGDRYEVRGVDIFMKLLYPPFAGDSVGLLVKRLTEET